MTAIDARRLRRAIIFYAALAMVAIGMTVAVIAIGPLAVRLRDNARAGLEHELAIKAMAAEQVLDNARNLAQQVTSRTVIRERLEVYNRGDIPLGALTEFTRDKLADAMTMSKDLVGISRFAAKGEPVVSVGPFAEEGPAPPPVSDRAVLGLRVQAARQFIVVAAPIVGRDRKPAGTDVVVVDAADLQAILDDAAAIGKTGWAALVDGAGQPRQLMSSSGGRAPWPLVERMAARVAAGAKAGRDEDGEVVVAAAPLQGTSWVLVQAIAADEATRQVDIFLLWVVVGAVMTTALGVGGLALVLRPLTGAFLVQNADLARQVEELQQAKAELAEKSHSLALSNADLQAYAYAASHELQEPVRGIVSFAQLLQRRYGGQMGGEADEFIGFIVDSAERMRRQINDLLSYTALDQAEPDPQPVPLGAVVEAALAILAPVVASTDARIGIGTLPSVRGRRDALVRLFENLIGNALKFTAAGEPPRIEISARQDDRWVEVCVRDHGIGIEPEFHERIFRMFERLEPGHYPGTGIGLAICRKVAEMHGGRIWVESVRGNGAAFHVRLPAGKDAMTI